ncbi:hypothetical protein FOCC_FOCC012898 [Frankliniella occidentalis]|nr:hypothetical protein FOCC_FOCC012898 [Frankliniella occidentalis]
MGAVLFFVAAELLCGSCQGEMDALPDELLLLILGRVADGRVLLYAVPLVCKRWRRLSRDPRVWRRVEVSLGGCDHGPEGDDDEDTHGDLLEAARVLLHAPLLRSISFDWIDYCNGPWSCDFEKRVTVSALKRCKASVSEFHFPEPDYDTGSGIGRINDPLESFDESDRALVLGFILKHRNEVRVLTLGRLLLVNSWPCDVNTSPAGMTGLLNDLLRGSAASLRHLRFVDDSVPKDVLRTVRVCAELQSLACRVQDLPLVGELPCLLSLDVNVSSGDSGHPNAAASLPALARYLETNKSALPRLRSVDIDSSIYFNYDKDWLAAHQTRLVRVFKSLGVFCSGAVKLKLTVVLEGRMVQHHHLRQHPSQYLHHSPHAVDHQPAFPSAESEITR